MPERTKLTERELLLEALNKLDANERNNQKQFFALVGVIMALIGQKLIATPWYVDTAVILCLFAGTFLSMTLIHWWKKFTLSQKCTRVFASALMLSSAICQIFVYHPGIEKAPPWFAPMINGLMICLAISMIWQGWSMPPKGLVDGKNG